MNFTSQIQSSLSLLTQMNQDITAKAWGKAEHHKAEQGMVELGLGK